METLFQAIVLAAGKSSRIATSIPKVLLPICGQPMLEYVLDALDSAGLQRPIIVVNKKGGLIREVFGDAAIYAIQENQLGSGHAVLCARDAASEAKNILVVCGDSPLFRAETIRTLMDSHIRENAVVSLTSALIEDPSGYGRIIRSKSGKVIGVVEDKLAEEEVKAVKEINGGCYAFNAEWLWSNLGNIGINKAGEYNLTELVGMAASQELNVITVNCMPEEVLGVNTFIQLRGVEEILQRRRF